MSCTCWASIGRPVAGRIGRADAGEQQPQIVVDLGHGADGGARVLRRGLLLDRDRRRQARDMVDVGLFHHVEELPRIGRQAFDIAALALGIDRVEGQAGLARARQPGDHHQLVARNIHVDVLEVVFARAAHLDMFQLSHRVPRAPPLTDSLCRRTLQAQNENTSGTSVTIPCLHLRDDFHGGQIGAGVLQWHGRSGLWSVRCLGLFFPCLP